MAVGFNTSFSDITGAIGDIGSWFSSNSQDTNVGGSGESSGYQTNTGSETVTEQLSIDAAGVMKYVNDLLKDPNMGLANVVGQDRASGLYGSSSAAFATNDLLDKIAGTIAQLTAKKTSVKNIDTRSDMLSRQNMQQYTKTKKPGFLASAFGSVKKLFSDARLKTNIMRISTTPGGLPWYRYEFLGVIPAEGVLAQDLLILLPDAVERHESGYFMVDYSKVH